MLELILKPQLWTDPGVYNRSLSSANASCGNLDSVFNCTLKGSIFFFLSHHQYNWCIQFIKWITWWESSMLQPFKNKQTHRWEFAQFHTSVQIVTQHKTDQLPQWIMLTATAAQIFVCRLWNLCLINNLPHHIDGDDVSWETSYTVKYVQYSNAQSARSCWDY